MVAKQMNLEDIQNLAEKDLKIDHATLDHASLATPLLHHKYLKIFTQESLLLKKMRVDFDVLYKNKWLYYSGKASPEEYKKSPFELKVLRNDLEIFLNADAQLNELKLKVELQTAKVKFLEDVLKNINNLNWTIRNAVDFKKFLAGVN